MPHINDPDFWDHWPDWKDVGRQVRITMSDGAVVSGRLEADMWGEEVPLFSVQHVPLTEAESWEYVT